MASASSSGATALIFKAINDQLFQIPLNSFIDNHCEKFTDTDTSYSEMHDEYRHVVTALLDAVKQDANLDEATFLAALQQVGATRKGDPNYESAKHLIATEKYEVFVNLMIQRNIELQEQALATLLSGGNHMPDAYDLSNKGRNDELTDDDAMLQQAIQMSREEYERQEARKRNDVTVFRANPFAEVDVEPSFGRSAQSTEQQDDSDEEVSPNWLSRDNGQSQVDLERKKEAELRLRMQTVESKMGKLQVTNDVDAEMLREQRERLLRAKQEDDEEALEKAARKAAGQRPKSSRVAQKAWKVSAGASSSGSVNKSSSGYSKIASPVRSKKEEPIVSKLIENDREAAIRRAIAGRLKSEVLKK